MKGWIRKKVSLIGAGNVGTALATLIAGSDLPFGGIYSRRMSSSRRATRSAGKGKVFESIDALIDTSDIILISVKDSEIHNVMRMIEGAGMIRRNRLSGKVFIHTSGAFPSTVLSPLIDLGGSIASMHPLQTIPALAHGADLLKKSFFSIEGGKKASAAARTIVKKIGAKSFALSPDHKSEYHLAATFLSNYIVSLSDMVLDMLADSRRSKRELSRIFAPLIAGVAENLEKMGVSGALSGPISRGDVVIVNRHLDVLKSKHEDLRKLYSIFARRAVEIAVRNHKLDRKKRRLLMRLLSESELLYPRR